MVDQTIACLITECMRISYRQGLCRRHHYRLITHGDALGGGEFRSTEHTETCTIPGCVKPYVGKGLCRMHYQRRAFHGDPLYQPTFAKDQPCTVRGCIQLQAAKGYCDKHYQRYLLHGDPEVCFRSQRYGTVSYKGYLIISKPGHPNASKHGKIPEHRFVMSEMLGRPLLAHEVVHHKNGNRLDNCPENLELWVKTQPCGQRAVDLLVWAKDIIVQYTSLEDNPYFASSAPRGKTRKVVTDDRQLLLEGVGV